MAPRRYPSAICVRYVLPKSCLRLSLDPHLKWTLKEDTMTLVFALIVLSARYYNVPHLVFPLRTLRPWSARSATLAYRRPRSRHPLVPGSSMCVNIHYVIDFAKLTCPPQRVNPAHADIPSYPERYSKDSDYYWYYGFALSTEEIHTLAKRHVPWRLNGPDERPTSTMVMMRYLLSFCRDISRWRHTRQMLVKPVPEDADNMTQDAFPSPIGQPTVIFFAVMSTEEDHFESRPGQEQVDTLVRILKKEPEWREDAIPKSEWMFHYGYT